MRFHPFEGLLQLRFRTVRNAPATVCAAVDVGRQPIDSKKVGEAMMTLMLAGLPAEQLRASSDRSPIACGGRPSERAWALLAAMAAIAIPLILALSA
jgi:hypothetical protein